MSLFKHLVIGEDYLKHTDTLKQCKAAAKLAGRLLACALAIE